MSRIETAPTWQPRPELAALAAKLRRALQREYPKPAAAPDWWEVRPYGYSRFTTRHTMLLWHKALIAERKKKRRR